MDRFIEKLLRRSTLKELSEILIDPEEEIRDCLVVYTDRENNIHIDGTCTLLEALGLNDIANDVIKDLIYGE